jgi:hypothetical protein
MGLTGVQYVDEAFVLLHLHVKAFECGGKPTSKSTLVSSRNTPSPLINPSSHHHHSTSDIVVSHDHTILVFLHPELLQHTYTLNLRYLGRIDIELAS